jgi:hypothetical protein
MQIFTEKTVDKKEAKKFRKKGSVEGKGQEEVALAMIIETHCVCTFLKNCSN